MNKTVKTIAWICLVLGLLGIAVDAVVLVRAQSFRANMAERIASGEIPSPKIQPTEKDNDSDAKKDQNGDAPGRGQRLNLLLDGRQGRISGKMPFYSQFGRVGGRMMGLRSPLLFAAAGPILAVLGAVTLIVNREPKVKTKKAKETTKKEKPLKN